MVHAAMADGAKPALEPGGVGLGAIEPAAVLADQIPGRVAGHRAERRVCEKNLQSAAIPAAAGDNDAFTEAEQGGGQFLLGRFLLGPGKAASPLGGTRGLMAG